MARVQKPRSVIVSPVSAFYGPNYDSRTGQKPGKNIPTKTKTKEGYVIRVLKIGTGAAMAFIASPFFKAIWTYDVESSNISKIAYDPGNKEMRIRFLNGSYYAYANVSLEEFLGIMAAASHGHYFWANIRKPGLPGSKQYAYQKLE